MMTYNRTPTFCFTGTQAWLREEALAHITAVEMFDLPVSAQEASMQEEFGQSDGKSSAGCR